MLSVLFAARRAWTWTRSTWASLSTDLRTVLLVLVGAVALLAARSCSRPPPPTREVETREATADRETFARILAQLEERRHEEVQTTATRTDTRPDGRKVVTIIERRRVAQVNTSAASAADVHAVAHETTREVREVERARPSWRLGASAGWSLTRPQLRPELLGVDLSRRVAGPVWLGAWARTDRTAGVALAVEW
jgi:hypothetical protein